MGGRIREALGGGARSPTVRARAKGKVDKAAKGGGKVTTPRKAGGS